MYKVLYIWQFSSELQGLSYINTQWAVFVFQTSTKNHWLSFSDKHFHSWILVQRITGTFNHRSGQIDRSHLLTSGFLTSAISGGTGKGPFGSTHCVSDNGYIRKRKAAKPDFEEQSFVSEVSLLQLLPFSLTIRMIQSNVKFARPVELVPRALQR